MNKELLVIKFLLAMSMVTPFLQFGMEPYPCGLRNRKHTQEGPAKYQDSYPCNTHVIENGEFICKGPCIDDIYNSQQIFITYTIYNRLKPVVIDGRTYPSYIGALKTYNSRDLPNTCQEIIMRASIDGEQSPYNITREYISIREVLDKDGNLKKGYFISEQHFSHRMGWFKHIIRGRLPKIKYYFCDSQGKEIIHIFSPNECQSYADQMPIEQGYPKEFIDSSGKLKSHLSQRLPLVDFIVENPQSRNS